MPLLELVGKSWCPYHKQVAILFFFVGIWLVHNTLPPHHFVYSTCFESKKSGGTCQAGGGKVRAISSLA